MPGLAVAFGFAVVVRFAMLIVGVRAMVIMRGVMIVAVPATVVLVELLGAIGTFEFMALAGNGKGGNGHEKDGK